METIDLNNYEEYLLSYIDGELEPAREAELLRFLEAHPALKQELALLEATRLTPDESIVFRGKASLYRQSSGARIIRSRWWVAAAAAAAAVVILILYLPRMQEEMPAAGHLPLAATVPAAPRSLPADTPSSLRPAPSSADTASAHILPAAAPAGEEKPSEERHPAEAGKKAGTRTGKPGQAVVPEKSGQAVVPEPAAPSPPVATLHPIRYQVTGIKDQIPGIRDQASRIGYPVSGIRDQASGIQDRTSGIQGQGSRIKDQGSSIQDRVSGIQDQGSRIKDPGSSIQDRVSGIQDPGSSIQDQGSSIQDRGSSIQDQVSGTLSDAKERLDNSITDKITGLQDRISHPFRELKGKKIRIGRVEIAMNN